MTRSDWRDDRRPVRRVVANESAPRPGPSASWPASIPAVAQVLDEGLTLPAGVTLLVGENGSGKSTLVEAVAMALYFTRHEEFRTRHDPFFHELSHGESFLEVLRTRFN